MMHALNFATWNDWALAVVLLGLGVALLALGVQSREVTPVQAQSPGAGADAPLQQLVNPLPRWWMGVFVVIVSAALLFVLSHPRQPWQARAIPAAAAALQGQQAQAGDAPAQRPTR